ncbi:MAG: VCBS repeat-containing protein [Sphingobacteriales bacterium]|nr:VCBS repeat-containing protein [Sphingobacteriales bacterium]
MFTQTHTRIFCFFLLCLTYCYPTTNCQAQTTFGPKQVISTTNASGASSVYAIDLDGDSDNDVLSCLYSDNTIAWYINDGSGNFSNEQIISTNADYANSVYAIDLDGDGDNDVLSASINDDKIAWYINDGSGNFSSEQIISTTANGAWSVYAIDIDGDGDNDVLSNFLL